MSETITMQGILSRARDAYEQSFHIRGNDDKEREWLNNFSERLLRLAVDLERLAPVAEVVDSRLTTPGAQKFVKHGWIEVRHAMKDDLMPQFVQPGSIERISPVYSLVDKTKWCLAFFFRDHRDSLVSGYVHASPEEVVEYLGYVGFGED